MDDRKQPPVALLMLPLVALGAMLAVQYFAPPKAQTEEPAVEQAGEQPKAADAAGQRPHAGRSARVRRALADGLAFAAESQQLYKLENERIVASFTDLNTAMVSLQVKGERYLDEEGSPFELVTTDKEAYLPLAPSFSGVKVPPDARWRSWSPRTRSSASNGPATACRSPAPGSSPSRPTNFIPRSKSATTIPVQGRSAWASPRRTTSAAKTKRAASSEGRHQP